MIKKLFIVLMVLVALFVIYRVLFKKEKPPKEKPVPVTVSKQSAVFNQSMNMVLTAYYALSEGFVNWDGDAVNREAGGLQTALHNFKAEELKKDSMIYQTVLYPLDLAKTNTKSILASSDWTERRHALNDLSDNLRTILLAVKYDQAPVYWQECPMAFGEGQSGNWLSNGPEVVNPYLGNKDPKFGKSMLNCGELKSTIDFTGADSAQKK